MVLHGASEDLKFLNNLDPDITQKACYVLDTVKAAQFPFGLSYRYSLKYLLDELGIQYANLHAGGNDAHFALKALLMIAVRDCQKISGTFTTLGERTLGEILTSIALSPLPVPSLTPELTAAPAANKVVAKKKLGVNAKRRLKSERRRLRREGLASHSKIEEQHH